MTIRSRTRTNVGAQGSYYKYFFGSVDQGTVYVPGQTASCQDVVGSRTGDNPLLIQKTTWNVVPVNDRRNQLPNADLKLQDYTPTYYRSAGNFGHLGLPTLTDPADVTKVFARTNPSRTVLDTPAAVGELKELPAFLFNAGRGLIKNGVKNTFRFDSGFVKSDLAVIPGAAANGYLSYEYGWKPFLSDVKALLDFQRHVLARETELRKLHSKGGLSRRFQISSDSATAVSTNIFVESSLFTMYSTSYTTHTVRKRWGSAKWLPDLASHPITDAELHKQAVQAVYGLSLDGASAWELMPWSWLFDWCSSMGDYLEANRNTVGATCAGACLMTHTKTTHIFRKMVHNLSANARGGEATIVTETKQRAPYSSPIIFSDVPHLDYRKQSILGALGIQRTRGVPILRL